METKKQKIVSAVATMGIVLTLFGATYAYFVSRTDAGKTTDIEITANTVDVFSFETGDSISLSIDQENFASGTGNQTGETFARAILSANNKTNTATEHYYLFLNIESNSFTYSKDSDHPEILVKITDSDGKELVDSDIDGLTHKTVVDAKGNTVTGFDVTTKTGMITILNNREITTTSTKTENWTFTVTFVNYDFNQASNAGNNFKASVMIQKEGLQTLADYVIAQYTGTQGENNLYYHDSTLANGANDNSYRYAGSSATTNNYVCFGSDADTCPNDNLYRIIGVFDGRVRLIKADYATSALLGTDTSDYSGTYSYVTSYYKGDSSNLTNIARYYWNNVNYSASNTATGYYNDWSYSELNKTHLNKNFLANLGTEWANMIDKTVWKVGGFASTDVVPSTLYINEITSPSTQVASTYESKVGLMYVSDYAFAAAPTAWTTTPYNYEGNDASGNKITEENWMYMGLLEWTMARSSSYSYRAGFVYVSGWVVIVNVSNYVSSGALGARPVFHLTSKIAVLAGDGTLEFPLKISDGA